MTLPKFALNLLAVKFSRSIIRMHRKFDKSFKIDQARRNKTIPQILLMKKIREGVMEAEKQFQSLFQDRSGSESLAESFGGKSRVKCVASTGAMWGVTSVQVRADLEEVRVDKARLQHFAIVPKVINISSFATPFAHRRWLRFCGTTTVVLLCIYARTSRGQS